ncbi:MAG: restriction endonuclease subunit S [Candidatus Paceibacterota bacterium]
MSNLLKQIEKIPRATYKLIDVTSRIGDGLHGTPVYDDNGEYYFINGNNLDNGYVSIKKDTKKVNESEYIKHKKDLTERTLLLSINGTIGNLAKYKNEKCILGKSVSYINISDGFDLNYFYYVLLDNRFKKHITNNASGSTIKNVSLEQLRDYEINIPNLSIQKKISEILSAYDEKIENNNKIIKNLETTAQTIFNEWFVNFHFPGYEKVKMIDSEMGKIPEGWEMKKISRLATVTLGGTPSRDKKEFWGGSIPWINSGEINNLRIIKATEYISEAGLKKSNASIMNSGTTLLAITGATLGQVSRLEIESTANQSVVGIYDENNILNEYIYLCIKNNILDIISGASGGAQQHINKQLIENYKMLIPLENITYSFNGTIKPMFNFIKESLLENQKLKQSRDQLLAKLI